MSPNKIKIMTRRGITIVIIKDILRLTIDKFCRFSYISNGIV